VSTTLDESTGGPEYRPYRDDVEHLNDELRRLDLLIPLRV
jgi:hypothetical protein